MKRTADGNWGDGGDVDDIAGAQENAAIAAQAAVEAAASAAAAEGVGASVAVWPSGTTRTMKQRATDTYCILDAPGNPDPTGVNDSSAALKAMIAGGVQCELTKGDFVTTEPLLFKTTGQKVVGQGRGYGYGRADYFARDFQPMSRVIAAGTFAKRILTRRKHRASGADLKDDPMSAAIEIHADGIGFQDWLLWLNCDYTDLSHTNLGDNIDIGVLRTGRPGFNTVNFGIIGHFRKTRLLQEYTRALNLPELLDPDGAALPKGASGETFAGATAGAITISSPGEASRGSQNTARCTREVITTMRQPVSSRMSAGLPATATGVSPAAALSTWRINPDAGWSTRPASVPL